MNSFKKGDLVFDVDSVYDFCNKPMYFKRNLGCVVRLAKNGYVWVYYFKEATTAIRRGEYLVSIKR
tara:strand:+ start:235 stop:432 length:198 start_codon:yes stop_codon:yes gene_type:complete